VIYPVDPLTLEVLPGFEPLPMCHRVWGQPSADGRYFAATVGDDDGGEADVRLIDVAEWAQVASWSAFPDSVLHVTDEGTLFFVSYGTYGRLHRLQIATARRKSLPICPLASAYGGGMT
jgi:hypothetical protein